MREKNETHTTTKNVGSGNMASPRCVFVDVCPSWSALLLSLSFLVVVEKPGFEVRPRECCSLVTIVAHAVYCTTLLSGKARTVWAPYLYSCRPVNWLCSPRGISCCDVGVERRTGIGCARLPRSRGSATRGNLGVPPRRPEDGLEGFVVRGKEAVRSRV